MKKKKDKRGPKENHLKIKGNWQKAVNKALKKKRPKRGWPK
jgi:nicotinate-nucleotide pyrophosphorylase